jgi:hypothetical protein
MFAADLFTALRFAGLREFRAGRVPGGGDRAVQALGTIDPAPPTDADCSPSITITSRVP